MRPRILDLAMSDQDYEALKKKLLETYCVLPTLLNPTVKRLVDWHCVEGSCFMDNQVFDRREKWMRHHQRFHNRMCEGDRGYPREIEAKQFIQEHELRENARLGIAGAGGSTSLVPHTVTRAGPYPRISGALNAIPLMSAAPSSSTSGELRNSATARRRGPYRVRANNATRRQEHPDPGFVNVALKDEPESSGTLEAARREILMQQLSCNLQAVYRINADSVHIMQTLGLPSTNCVSEIRRPAGSKRPRESLNTGAQGNPATTAVAAPVPLPTWVDRRALTSTSTRARGLQAGQSKFVAAASQAPAHSNVGRLRIFEATPHPSQTPAHSNEGRAHVFEATPHPSLDLALSLGGPDPPLSVELPAHPYEGPPLSIEGPVQLALTFMTPSQSEEKEEEENYNAASDSEKVDSDSEDQAADVSQSVYEGHLEWKDVKVDP